MDQIDVDARGHRCPVPTLRLQRALALAPSGATVALLADDPLARVDVSLFASAQGYLLVSQQDVAGEDGRSDAVLFLVKKPNGVEKIA